MNSVFELRQDCCPVLPLDIGAPVSWALDLHQGPLDSQAFRLKLNNPTAFPHVQLLLLFISIHSIVSVSPGLSSIIDSFLSVSF